VDQVFQGELLTGVSTLKGCGAGLTPAGDDFIAGLLIALNLLQTIHQANFRDIMDAVHKCATGDNPFSNAFLDWPTEACCPNP